MKVTIIGAGNMGGAIARGLATEPRELVEQIIVLNRSKEKLDKLKSEYPNLLINVPPQEAINQSNVIILAVKPWLVETVLKNLSFKEDHILISVAAGVECKTLKSHTPHLNTIFRIIPNTAIAEKVSMNIITSIGADKKKEELIEQLFQPLGFNLFIAEENFPIATAIASCGIAYLFKYIQAAMQAGVELGLSPKEAKSLAAQSAIGAGTILMKNQELHPATEIDKVTTPGGFTIKGINELEKHNFSNAIISAIKKSI